MCNKISADTRSPQLANLPAVSGFYPTRLVDISQQLTIRTRYSLNNNLKQPVYKN